MNKLVTDSEHITIVGGGITGLSAANFLIYCGHAPEKITLIEKSSRWGGHVRTLYLYKDNTGQVRIVTEYKIDLENPELPRLRPVTPTSEFLEIFPRGFAELGKSNILPTDTAFSIFTPSYHNYACLLSKQISFPAIDTSMKSDIRRSYHLRNEIFLESYLPLFGLWRQPLRFLTQIPGLIYFKWQLKHFITAVEKLELKSMTVTELFSESKIKGTLFGNFTAAMVGLYNGYEQAQLEQISARYFVDFLKITNLEQGFKGIKTALLGNSLSISVLVNKLRENGVKLINNAAYNAECSSNTVIFAQHPWNTENLQDLRFDQVNVPVYVNCSEWGHFDADNHYQYTQESSFSALDVDRYRPRFPDYGVQITFGVSGQDEIYETKMCRDAAEKGKQLEIKSISDYKGESLDEIAVKLSWQHAYVTPEFEGSREEVGRRQGRDGFWYASASLYGSARHEDGVTSALDTVIRMKGESGLNMLRQQGFIPSANFHEQKR